MRILRFLLGGMALLFLLKSGNAQAVKTAHVSFYVDTAGNAGLPGIAHRFREGEFKKLSNNILPIKKHGAVYWLAYTIQNQGATTASLTTELADAYIDEINYSLLSGDSVLVHVETGCLQPFANRPFAYKYFIFPQSVAPHSTVTCLISIKNVYHNSVVPVNFYPNEGFSNHLQQENLLWGMYTGLFLLVSFLALLLYFFLGEQIYLFSFGYVVTSLLWAWSNNGMGYQYIWSIHPEVMLRIRFIASMLAIAFLLQVTQSFLMQQKDNSRFYTASVLIKWLLLLPVVILLIPVNLAHFQQVVIPFIIAGDGLLIVAVVLILLSLLESILSGNRSAIYYQLSILVLLSGVVMLIFAKIGVIPANQFTLNCNYIGLFLQVWFIVIGLAIRYNQLRKEKEAFKISMLQQESEAQLNIALARENERKRIASDMHDDLGSGLSGLRIVSELASRKQSREEMKNDLGRVIDHAKELNEKVKDIIWTLNTDNDTLLNFIYYIHHYGAVLFEDAAILFEMNIPEDLPEVIIDGNKRKHLVMIIKEAFTNILKHAKATTVTTAITWNNGNCSIRISDNGVGLIVKNKYGNGISNMKKRIETLGGSMEINSGEGTIIEYRCPL